MGAIEKLLKFLITKLPSYSYTVTSMGRAYYILAGAENAFYQSADTAVDCEFNTVD